MARKAKEAAKDEEQTEAKGGKKKLIIIVLPVVLIVAAAGWFLFLKPSGAPKGPVKPTPGLVTIVDPITINLAGGHFLKLGLALQADTTLAEAPDGSKALDAAIEIYSGMTITDLATKQGRDTTKAELVKQVYELYEKKVYDVYFTEFVYQ